MIIILYINWFIRELVYTFLNEALSRDQAWAGNCGRPPGYRYSNPHSPTENLIAWLNNEQKRVVVVFSNKLCLKSVSYPWFSFWRVSYTRIFKRYNGVFLDDINIYHCLCSQPGYKGKYCYILTQFFCSHWLWGLCLARPLLRPLCCLFLGRGDSFIHVGVVPFQLEQNFQCSQSSPQYHQKW